MFCGALLHRRLFGMFWRNRCDCRRRRLVKTLDALGSGQWPEMVIMCSGADKVPADFFEPGSRTSRKHSDPGTMLGPPVRGPRKGTDGNVRVPRGGAASFDFDGLRRKVERAFRE